jgi:hypothetical protein
LLPYYARASPTQLDWRAASPLVSGIEPEISN